MKKKWCRVDEVKELNKNIFKFTIDYRRRHFIHYYQIIWDGKYKQCCTPSAAHIEVSVTKKLEKQRKRKARESKSKDSRAFLQQNPS